MKCIRKISGYLILAVAAVSLTACAGGMGDLMEYIDDVKARPGGRIEPLPQIKPYETFAYQATLMRSPFTPDRPDSPRGNVRAWPSEGRP